MKIKSNKLIATGMAITMSMGMAIPAFAEGGVSVDVAGGTGTTEAVLTAEGAAFKVTVPMQLPITVDADGKVTTATDAKIVNGSCGAVIVKDVSFAASNGWTGVNFGKDMTAEKVGAKKLGFKINDCLTDEAGAFVFSAEKFPSIAAINDGSTDELSIVYDANVAAQKTAITAEKVADVVFTIGWDEAESSPIV